MVELMGARKSKLVSDARNSSKTLISDDFGLFLIK